MCPSRYAACLGGGVTSGAIPTMPPRSGRAWRLPRLTCSHGWPSPAGGGSGRGSESRHGNAAAGQDDDGHGAPGSRPVGEEVTRAGRAGSIASRDAMWGGRHVPTTPPSPDARIATAPTSGAIRKDPTPATARGSTVRYGHPAIRTPILDAAPACHLPQMREFVGGFRRRAPRSGRIAPPENAPRPLQRVAGV
jgi:hypothetical protein